MSVDSPAGGNVSGMTFDLNSLNALKAKATKDPNAAVKGAAKQLETLFMQELMKTMRASTLNSGMLENNGTQMGTEMLDTEFAGRMSGLPHGLSAAIERQLSRQVGGKQAQGAQGAQSAQGSLGVQGAAATPTAFPAPGASTSTASLAALSGATSAQPAMPLSRLSLSALQAATQMPGGMPGSNDSTTDDSLGALTRFNPLGSLDSMLGFNSASTTDTPASMGPATLDAAPVPAAAANAAAGQAGTASAHLSPAESFVRRHQAAAHAIEAETGIPAANLIGQAAHETGWGKHEIKNKDGTPSHNLFGIKASSDWTGKVAEVTTTEYIGGVARRVTAKFRSYESYEDAFRDHAKLLTSSPRYSSVVAQASSAQGYAKSLQKAGYATDPAYADKLARVINTTLRLQRTVT